MRDPASTLQLVFLVGDAPPLPRPSGPGTTYPAAVVDAVARGIKVFPIASSESDDQAEVVFRESPRRPSPVRVPVVRCGRCGHGERRPTSPRPTMRSCRCTWSWSVSSPQELGSIVRDSGRGPVDDDDTNHQSARPVTCTSGDVGDQLQQSVVHHIDEDRCQRPLHERRAGCSFEGSRVPAISTA